MTSGLRDLTCLDKFRVTVMGDRGDACNGAFLVPYAGPGARFADTLARLIGGAGGLRIIAGCGFGWDHVSVSLPDRTPTWEEMQYVRQLFFEDWATVMQLHPPLQEHISVHPHCLHLWRPHGGEVPRPPAFMVA